MDLSKNKVSQVDKLTFYGLEKLEFLDLSNNEIENVEDFAFEHLLMLRELNLNDNRISKLSADSFTGKKTPYKDMASETDGGLFITFYLVAYMESEN